jgi:hypothetical protein
MHQPHDRLQVDALNADWADHADIGPARSIRQSAQDYAARQALLSWAGNESTPSRVVDNEGSMKGLSA